MKKYELLINDTINEVDGTLFRIKALTSFGEVKEGDLGGYIGSEDNLSHRGNAWISGYARVSGNARVSGDAQVSEYARVSGNAWISEYAQVFGNAWVHDNTHVSDNARISGNAWIYDNAWVSGNVRVSDDAHISGETHASGSAIIFGNARVTDNARVSDNAWVFGNAIIFGNAHVTDNVCVCGNAHIYDDARVLGNNFVSGNTSVSGNFIMKDQLKNDYLEQAFEAELKKGTISEQVAIVFKRLIRKALNSNQDIQISLEELDSILNTHSSKAELEDDLSDQSLYPYLQVLRSLSVSITEDNRENTNMGRVKKVSIFQDIQVTDENGFEASLTKSYRKLCELGG